jgi:5'-3' exonuclease
MINLDYFIQRFLAENAKAGSFSVKNIVYSSHLVPGEGEHKIFDMLRAGKESLNIPDDKNILVYGKDADLFMLTLLSPNPNIYLIREDLNESINIDELRKLIYKDMVVDTGEEEKIPVNIAIQD